MIEMDIQTRKMAFVQDFLKLQSEEILTQFENLLKLNLPKETEQTHSSMSIEALNNRIGKSEEDFKNNRYKESATLLAKYQR